MPWRDLLASTPCWAPVAISSRGEVTHLDVAGRRFDSRHPAANLCTLATATALAARAEAPGVTTMAALAIGVPLHASLIGDGRLRRPGADDIYVARIEIVEGWTMAGGANGGVIYTRDTIAVATPLDSATERHLGAEDAAGAISILIAYRGDDRDRLRAIEPRPGVRLILGPEVFAVPSEPVDTELFAELRLLDAEVIAATIEARPDRTAEPAPTDPDPPPDTPGAAAVAELAPSTVASPVGVDVMRLAEAIFDAHPRPDGVGWAARSVEVQAWFVAQAEAAIAEIARQSAGNT